MMDAQQQPLSRLREALERRVNKRMHTSKDFEYLSMCIFEQTRQSISPSTLKRLCGYLDEGVVPRRSTLDVLSQFLGYREWDDFCEQAEKPAAPDNELTPNPSQEERDLSPVASKGSEPPFLGRRLWIGISVFAAVLLLLL